MSTPKVDVLAVLDDVLGTIPPISPQHQEWLIRVKRARAAVAELIEAANRAAIAACRGDGSHPGTIRNADLDALRAALARIGDAS